MSVLITQPRQQLKFADGNAFQLELRRRVEEYFRTTGRRPRDCWQMYLKTAILLAGFAVSYTLLVFVDQTWWQGLLLAVLLGLSAAGIGFNIQHDGGHQAYSNHPWVNKLMAMTLELIGGSSHLWRWKHVVLHHTYVNITGHDTDIDLGLLARLTPHQRRLPYHRWQHLYLWPLYGLLAIKWQLLDDFRKLISGRISNQPFPGPKGRELVIFIAGKADFFTMAFGIPRLCHVNYPAISKLVEETCREFGIKYTEHRSFRAGLASHFRWLRRMGMPTTKSGEPGAWPEAVDSKSAPRVRPARWSRRCWPRSSVKRTSRSSPGKA